MEKKINDTKPLPSSGPMSETLSDMKEYDMNKLKDKVS